MINWNVPRWIAFLIIVRGLIYLLPIPSGHDVFGLLMTSGILFLAWTQLGTRGQLRPFLLGIVLYWFGNLFDWFDGLLHKQGTWGHIVDTLDDVFFTAGFFFIVLAFIRVTQEHDQLENRLYQQACRDELTGLGNRRALFETLHQRLKSQTGTILYIDINHFKQVNDQQGHEHGDLVLRECAKQLKQVPGTAFRIGGDEFILLLNDENPSTISAQLHQQVTSLTASDGISFSIGIAHFSANQFEDPDALLAQADQQMYAAKLHFRNAGRATAAGLPNV